MNKHFDESIIDDLRVRRKLGIRVSPDIEYYTNESPYHLVWRFDFDETLVSVCNINGDWYDKDNLSDDDMECIEQDYDYLKNTAAFIECSGIFNDGEGKVLDDGSAYIDYVNEGWPNEDGKTYSYRRYLLTEKGNRLDLCSGNNAELSEDGYFTFDNLELPCITRIFEDGAQIWDYRSDSVGENP